ncbi:MAG: membrane protein insertion efficiency factor YidD [bacterium]|nr:membrane protein insertion efficiency factor YidD [bacterium]
MSKKLFLSVISFYRQKISPLTPPSCRYRPTCSEYAYEAIEKYGVASGGYMALRRILRCHPWSKGGYDPLR